MISALFCSVNLGGGGGGIIAALPAQAAGCMDGQGVFAQNRTIPPYQTLC